MEEANLFATVAGRFYYFVKPVYSLPYFADNMAVIKVFQFVPILICFLMFAKIVQLVTCSKEIAALYFLLFFSTMQISKHTNLFVSYPFYFSFSFFLVLLSVYFLILFYQKEKKRYLISSSISFAVGLLFYEVYILALVFLFIIVVYYNFRKYSRGSIRFRRVFFQFLPFLLIGIIYLTTYFIFRIYHPSHYPGTSFDTKEITVLSVLRVMWRLAYSSFPLTVYETSHYLFWDKSEILTGYSPVVLNLILGAKAEWLVKGVLVAFLGFKFLEALPRVANKVLLYLAAVAILLIFLPNLPLALTEKYRFCIEDGDMIGYVTTFFSFFGTLFFMSLIFTWVINLFNFNKVIKKIVAGLFVLGFFLCSVITDYSNYYIAKDIRSANLRLFAIDELLKTNEFQSIPPGSPFFAREMYTNPSYCAAGLTEQDFNWFEYFEAKTGSVYPVHREYPEFLDRSKKISQVPYFLTMRQTEKSEDIVLVMASIGSIQPQDSMVNHYADKALVGYYSMYKTFTISFRVKQPLTKPSIPIRINHIEVDFPPEEMLEFTIFDTRKGNAATFFTIQYPGIDLNSIMISNMWNRENKIFYL
ncbi:MAG TPA: hypothetical protein PKN12_05495 [Bacteroidales bacterium]|nr:hypothetical protein [Bacteroidales bacterium]